ncbi:MAG: hypothetical protein C0519_01320 [Hyphomicrobium sp.]|nr:hypothetical protein [Hyphomicrobium sp.]PPD09562.1 MAG: hypothetical protein CTY28_01780 [Hyphomicrobium sp.]
MHGNTARGVGILNNPVYVGRLVWNKLKYVKDPTTGKRRSRNNDKADVVEKDVPHLRIISDELWQRVKARQKAVSFTVTGAAKEPWDRRRPRYLLSGLTKCGCCGGGYVLISKMHLGCATARNKGLCSNRLAISRLSLEELVLSGLKHRLMAPDLFKEFCEAFFAEVNKARMDAGAQRASIEAELTKVRRRLRQIVDAIGDGFLVRSMKDELLALEAREDILLSQMEVAPQPKVLLNPKMADVYRSKVADLHAALDDPNSGPQAAEAIRALIEKIVVVPVDGKMTVDLYGEIGSILRLAAGSKNQDALATMAEQLVVVAGAGFEPTTFRL